MGFLTHPLFMLLVGLLGNLLLTLRDSGKGEKIERPIKWISAHPWRSTIGVLGALAAAGFLEGIGQFNAATALVAGMAGPQFLDLLARHSEDRMKALLDSLGRATGRTRRGP